MPAPFKPRHRFLMDFDEDGSFSHDLSRLVWDGDVLWGSTAEYAQSEIRPQTAQGGVILYNDGSLSIEQRDSVVHARLLHGNHVIGEWRAIPAVHEELSAPDFLYWKLEGVNAPALRTQDEFYETPQSVADFNFRVPADWRSNLRLSYVVVNTTPMEVIRQMAKLCGGFAYETEFGVMTFINAEEASKETDIIVFDDSFEPLASSYTLKNRSTVRTKATIASTAFVTEENNPVVVGSVEYRLAYNPIDNGLKYITFPWPRNRFISIISWAEPSHPADVTVTPGTGQGLLPVAPPSRSAWRGSVVMNRVISQADEAEGVIAFRANVRNLEITARRPVRNSTSDETAGQVDAALAPWVSLSRTLANAIIKPFLRRLSEPLEIVVVEYSEWQASESLLAALRRLKPGTVARVQIPKPEGNDLLVKMLVLSTRIRWGSQRIQSGLTPTRVVAGIALEKTFVVQDIDIEHEVIGHQGVLLLVSIASPDTSEQVYVRYRASSESDWTEVTSKRQDDDVDFSVSGLAANTIYTAQASLTSDYRSPAQTIFKTDEAPAVTEFHPLHDNNQDPKDISWCRTAATADRFLVLDGTRGSFFVYDGDFNYLEELSLPTKVRRSSTDYDVTYRDVHLYQPYGHILWLISYVDSRSTVNALASVSAQTYTYESIKASIAAAVTQGYVNGFGIIEGITTDPLSTARSIGYAYRDVSVFQTQDYSGSRRFGLQDAYFLGIDDDPNTNDATDKEDALPIPIGISWDDEIRVDNFGRPFARFTPNALFRFPARLLQQPVGIAPYDFEVYEAGFQFPRAQNPRKIAVVDHATRQIIPFNRDGTIVGGVTGLPLPRLSRLLINGIDVPGFSPNTQSYEIDMADFDESATVVRVRGFTEEADATITVNPSGQQPVKLDESQTFTVIVTNASGHRTYTLDVTYPRTLTPEPEPPPRPPIIPTDPTENVAPEVSITITPKVGVVVDDTFTVEWTSSDNAIGVRVEEVGVGNISSDANGAMTFTATAEGTRTFKISATNAVGTSTDQDSIEIGAKPEPVVVNPVIDFFTTSDTHLQSGETARLKWGTTDADRVTLQTGTNAPVLVDADSSALGLEINPVNTTEYTLRAFNGPREVQSQLTVARAVPKPVLVFTPDKKRITAGDSVTFTYSAVPATRASINGVDVPLDEDTISFSPTETTTYRFYAENTVGTVTIFTGISVTIGVDEDAGPGVDPPVLSVTLKPDEITEGESANLAWSTIGIGAKVTLQITEGVKIGDARSVPTSGNIQVSPDLTAVYTFRASNEGGDDREIVTLTVKKDVPLPTAELTVGVDKKTITIDEGESVTLRFTSTNGASASITNVGPTAFTGSVQVSPTRTTTYQFRVFNANGDLATSSVIVTVNQALEAPSAPRNLTGRYDRALRRVVLEWDAPEEQGSGRIIQYYGWRNILTPSGTAIFTNRATRVFHDNPGPGSHVYVVSARGRFPLTPFSQAATVTVTVRP